MSPRVSHLSPATAWAVVLRVLCVVVFGAAAIGTAAEKADLTAARALIKEKQYPEARAALEQILAAEPANAAAAHELGMLIRRRADNAAYQDALKWLAKAAELEPNKAVYQGDFGGTSLQLAARTKSVSAATTGRDALEKAVKLDPNYLDAREGLIQFYLQAPWPIGSSSKAAAHLEEMRQRAPERAMTLSVMMKMNAKDYAAAFKLCEEALRKDPKNYVALYYYGRTASISGQNLERGLDRLQRCLELEPPSPAAPTHSNVWHRIGVVLEHLKRTAEARTAYETALKLDPGNPQSKLALEKLR
jgi:tetratricopeptide (TPR) repeat protein